MPSNTCIVCGSTKRKGENVSMFWIPSDPGLKQLWLDALGLKEAKSHVRVCSRHFLHGNSSNVPSLNIGKWFASPKKDFERSARAKKRAFVSPVPTATPSEAHCSQSTPSESRESSVVAQTPLSTTDEESLFVPIGEPILSDSSYSIHELPSEQEQEKESTIPLKAKIEFLEAETSPDSSAVYAVACSSSSHFRVEHTANDDNLMKFYTGFHSYSLFLRFFEFLGPAAFYLNYWGDSKRKTARRRKLSLP